MTRKKNYFYKVIKLSGSSALSLVGISFYFVFASILDLLSIGLLGAYVAFIIDPKYISNELFIEIITIWQKFINSDHQIISVGILLCILFLFKSISSILLHKRIIQFSHIKQAQLRTTLMSIYKRMDYLSYIKRDTSEHITSMGSMVKNFGNSLQATLQCAGDIIVTLAIITFLLLINGPMLVTLIVFLSFLIFAYKFFFLNSLSLFGIKLNAGYQKMYQGVQEYFVAFKELKVLNSFLSFEKKIIDSSYEIAESDIRQSVITTIPRFILELVLVLFIVSIISITIINKGDIYFIIPTLSIFAAASLRLAPITYQFTRYIGTFRYTKDSIDKLYKDVHEFKYDQKKVIQDTSLPSNEDFKKLEIDSVEFSYDLNKVIFKNLNFCIKRGEAIGIVGVSGSGKTTMINLILGLIKPQKGTISENNKNIHNNFGSWRSKVAYLPQEIFLINDTIASNVALGIDKKEIDKEKVLISLQKAKLGTFLDTISDGIETIVGERGMALSGGQRQRVAIARAFYFDREVLILDEPTSSIDTKTENEIVSYLAELKGDKTIIIISHNTNATSFCDKVYTIKSGSLKN
tara:strand:- start:1874 stop:3604 length:1731 start_codon:yes stop_codon:yes gene_type:complete